MMENVAGHHQWWGTNSQRWRQIHNCQPRASLRKQKTTPEPHYFADYYFKTRAGTIDVQEPDICKDWYLKEIANSEEQIHRDEGNP